MVETESAWKLLLAPPWGFALAAAWGAIWGSFFNVAIHRLGREDARLRMLVWPPSSCPACGRRIRSRDNLPVLGWLLLRGRCRDCGAPISARYPLVELLSVALSLAVYRVFVLGHPDAPALEVSRYLVYFAFCGVMLVLSFIDVDTMLLPEAITLPSIGFFFLTAFILGDVGWKARLVGAVLGFGLLKGLQLGYLAATGREGLGGGDAMLMAIVGGLLGWTALPFTLGLGATFGTLVSVPLLWWQRRAEKAAGADPAAMQQDHAATQEKDAATQHDHAAPQETDPVDGESAPGEDDSLLRVEVPFGPFLAVAALCYLFLKDPAWAWWSARLSGP